MLEDDSEFFIKLNSDELKKEFWLELASDLVETDTSKTENMIKLFDLVSIYIDKTRVGINGGGQIYKFDGRNYKIYKDKRDKSYIKVKGEKKYIRVKSGSGLLTGNKYNTMADRYAATAAKTVGKFALDTACPPLGAAVTIGHLSYNAFKYCNDTSDATKYTQFLVKTIEEQRFFSCVEDVMYKLSKYYGALVDNLNSMKVGDTFQGIKMDEILLKKNRKGMKRAKIFAMGCGSFELRMQQSKNDENNKKYRKKYFDSNNRVILEKLIYDVIFTIYRNQSNELVAESPLDKLLSELDNRDNFIKFGLAIVKRNFMWQ